MQNFDPYIWREHRRKRMRLNEELRIKTLAQLNDALAELSRKYEWEEIFLFGSIVKPGKYGPGSDIDLCIKGLNKFSLYSFIGDISAHLDRNVDVVPMEECPFAEKILKSGVKWNPEKKS